MLRPPPPGGRILFARLQLSAANRARLETPASLYMRPGDRSERRRHRCDFFLGRASRWSCSPSCRRARKPDSTGRAATMPASRCRPAIPRCARRAATATARCRAWTFSYPGTAALGGSNARDLLAEEPGQAAGGEPLLRVRRQRRRRWSRCARARSRTRSTASAATIATSRSRPIRTSQACKQACEGDNRCRAWSFARPGYGGPTARCYLKDKITAPKRRPCCMSGVVR